MTHQIIVHDGQEVHAYTPDDLLVKLVHNMCQEYGTGIHHVTDHFTREPTDLIINPTTAQGLLYSRGLNLWVALSPKQLSEYYPDINVNGHSVESR